MTTRQAILNYNKAFDKFWSQFKKPIIEPIEKMTDDISRVLEIVRKQGF